MTDTEHNLETAESSPQSDENTVPVEAAPAPAPDAEVEDVIEETAPEEAPADETPEAEVVTEEASPDETPEAEAETPDAETETPDAEAETPDAEAVTEEATTEEAAQDEPPADEVSEADADPASETPPPDDDPRTKEGMNWFVLRVASNKEDYVRAALEKKVQIEGVQHLVGNIMVPTEKTKTLTKANKVKITETKLYPGYIFVEMKLVDSRISQDVFFLIKETTGVGDFVGTAGKPTPMSNDEVDKMLYDSQAPEEVTEVKLEFAKGDHVNVKEGPFMGYEGTVDEIFPEKGVVRLLATVFGRQTQIDIEYWMIEKAE
jgi:transcriptional antiterminator NusG